MWRWLTITYWRRRLALVRHRERLALLLWPFLSARERSEDDATPLWLLTRMVRAIENGAVDFPEDPPAQELWLRACADHDVREAAATVHILKRQLAGDPAAARLPVDRVTNKQLKPLHRRMYADRLAYSGQWLHAPLTLPLLSTLFLFSGWLFNTIFFGHFGLPVGRFFGLSDYLAASIDGLIPAVTAVAFGTIIQVVVSNRMRLKTLQNRLGRAWENTGATILVFSLMMLMALLQEPSAQARLQVIYTLMIAIPLTFVPVIVSFSRKPTRDTMLLSVVIIYLAVIWFTAEMRYASLETRPPRSEVTLAAAPDQPLRWRVISGNSLYLFLLNEQHEVVAVPVEQVLSVRYLDIAPQATQPDR